MKEATFEGILPAIVTPFNQEGDVEFKYLRQVVRFHLEKGVHGFFACGTAGEGPLMSTEQRKAVAETVSKEVGGRVPVIVHAGATSTRETVELAKHADETGAAAVGVVTPYYLKPDTEGLVEHYRRVAEAVDIPVFVYNIPQTTGLNITPDIMTKIFEIGNVVGVKDSSGNLIQIREIIEKAPKPVTVINGSDSLLFASLMVGAKATVSGIANIIPELLVELYEHYKRGEYKKALDLQTKINTVTRALGGPPIATLKTALELRGVKAGFPQMPLRPMKPEEVSRLKERLKSLNLFW